MQSALFEQPKLVPFAGSVIYKTSGNCGSGAGGTSVAVLVGGIVVGVFVGGTDVNVLVGGILVGLSVGVFVQTTNCVGLGSNAMVLEGGWTRVG